MEKSFSPILDLLKVEGPREAFDKILDLLKESEKLKNKKKQDFAYPLPESEGGRAFSNNGLTKREYFSGLAMQGLLADSNLTDDSPHKICNKAMQIADELLKQLEA